MSRSNSTPEPLANLYKKPLTKRFLPVKRYKILYMYTVGKIEKKLKNREHCRLQEWGRLDVGSNLANFLVMSFPKRSAKY